MRVLAEPYGVAGRLAASGRFEAEIARSDATEKAYLAGHELALASSSWREAEASPASRGICSATGSVGTGVQSARSPRKMRLTSADWSSSADGPVRMVRPDSRM
jgi:hypothetical protein